MRFSWDPQKARVNKRKHGVSFEEAAGCFADPLAMILEDPKRPEHTILIGESRASRLLFTVFVELSQTDDVIRIVSARKATRAERRRYEDGDY